MADTDTPLGLFSTATVVIMYMALAPYIASLTLKTSPQTAILVKSLSIYLLFFNTTWALALMLTFPHYLIQ